MTPQLSSSQLLHAEKVFQQKVDAKTLECASLDQMRKEIPALLMNIGNRLNCASLFMDLSDSGSVGNYLTAKLNQAVIELQELELQLKAIQSMSNRIQPAVLTGR